MKKHFCATFIAVVALTANASAQTLFTIEKDSVSVKSFLAAYKKNNTAARNDVQGMKDYLDLYIASRLKLREARRRGLDTLPQLISDLQGLRAQILPSYLNDEGAVNNLVKEAFSRSQKDIHLAHIFISAGKGDTIAASHQVTEIYKRLQKGDAFASLARQYSNDPSARDNGGEVGFITAFTLPYALENLIYATSAGTLSPVYHSAEGYHILKNISERKAVGRMKAAQILIAFPPDATEAIKENAKRLVDSLYKLLQKGNDFGKLATQFSNDVISAASNGQLQEFGVGEYEPAFENAVFGLAKDGAISKPFETLHGWHIVKRLGHSPVSTTLNEKTAEALRVAVEQSDRMNTTKDALAKKVIAEAGLEHSSFHPAALWLYTDSVVNNKNPRMHFDARSSYLTRIGRKQITVSDWISYAQANRISTEGIGLKAYEQQFQQKFLPHIALEYYKEHLEEFNPAFKAQMEEFEDGNLFFEIMQQQIWGPAQTDTAALLNYYTQHRTKYTWNKSADAVIFYAADATSANLLKTRLMNAPGNWKDLVAGLSEKIVADSNRFEFASIPNPTSLTLKKGTITTPLINKTDNTASFAYILQAYNESAQRTFDQAKGLVITDYQAALEKQWVDELKKKYTVKIDQKVWTTLFTSFRDTK